MKLSLQLYSMRDCADQIALLGQLPAMGVSQVEGYGGVYGDPKPYRAALDANGLSMPSGHMAISDIEEDFDATVALANDLGITNVFAPYLQEEDRPTTTAGYTEFAGRLNAAAAKFAAVGISFGWHNHEFEFEALADGGVPMDIILDNAPDITWEADIAWIVRGGRDPLEYINRYGDRITAVHIKDIAAEGTNLDEDGWSDLSAGTLDWSALLGACRGLKNELIYILEHDKPADPVGYATRSAEAFKTLWEKTND